MTSVFPLHRKGIITVDRTGGSFDCPACSPNSSRWLLGISELTNRANCFQCGPKNLIQVLCDATGHGYNHFVDLVKGLDHIRPSDLTHTGRFQAPVGLGPLLKPHREYLKSRGFKPSEIEKLWQIRGLGVVGHLSWRIWLPVILHGEPVSWLSRAVGEARQRYLSAKPEEESIPRGKMLYGADYCAHRAIVCEGPIDAWAIGPGCVSICGLSYSQAQVRRLSKYAVRSICFDNEPEAQKRARQLADDLSVLPGTTYVITLDAKDAGSASPREIKKVRKHFLE